jgi:hypothetical protein
MPLYSNKTVLFVWQSIRKLYLLISIIFVYISRSKKYEKNGPGMWRDCWAINKSKRIQFLKSDTVS